MGVTGKANGTLKGSTAPAGAPPLAPPPVQWTMPTVLPPWMMPAHYESPQIIDAVYRWVYYVYSISGYIPVPGQPIMAPQVPITVPQVPIQPQVPITAPKVPIQPQVPITAPEVPIVAPEDVVIVTNEIDEFIKSHKQWQKCLD